MSGEDYFKDKLVRLQPSDSWNKESGSEDDLTFVFIKGGIGMYVYQNASQRLLPGSILFFSGRSSGKLSADAKSECVFITFSLLLEHTFPLFAGNEIGMLHNVIGNFKNARIYPPTSLVASDCQPLLDGIHAQSRLIQRSQILRIVAHILAEEFKNVRSHQSGQDWAEDRMIQVFEKLSSAELLNLSVDELAAKFSCSRRHLNRLFHQHFNVSITALRMEIRLLKAVSLLRDPGAKVINVAEQCGFNHLGLFNTCFKRRFGTSPGQWRKLTIKTEISSAAKHENKENRIICPLQASRLCPLGGQLDAASQSGTKPAAGRVGTFSGILSAPNHWEATLGISSVADVGRTGSKAQPKSSV